MTRKEKKEQQERHEAVSRACADEQARFGHAIAHGARAILNTAFGPYRVLAVTPDFEVSTQPLNSDSWLDTRTFCIANDGRWADLLKQAGVERHPMFSR